MPTFAIPAFPFALSFVPETATFAEAPFATHFGFAPLSVGISNRLTLEPWWWPHVIPMFCFAFY